MPTAAALRQAGLEHLLFDDEAAARAAHGRERFHCEKVEPLRADLREHPRRETVAGRTRFAVRQAFQSENAIVRENSAPEGETRSPARRPPRAGTRSEKGRPAPESSERSEPAGDDTPKAGAPVDFPPAWRDLLHKTQRIPPPEDGGTVVWTYRELGRDLCAEPDPERRELIGNILRELAHPPGTHRFWPHALPAASSPDGQDDEAESAAAFFWEGARLLKSRAVVIMGSSALRALDPPPHLRELKPFGQALHLGRRIIVLPSPEIFVREPQRLSGLIGFLRPALASFARRPASRR
jgi:hypothetical protein